MNARERRWAIAVPMAIAIAGTVGLGLRGDGAEVAARGVSIAGAIGWASEAAGAVRWIAALLVAAAAALVAAAIGAARPGWPGRLGGVVAAAWMMATPATRGLGVTAGAVALPVLALLLVGFDRVARGGGAIAGRVTGVAAVSAVLVETRAWPAVLVAAALVLYRARKGARWGGDAAIAAGVAAIGWIGLAALAGGPVSGPIALRLDDAGLVLDALGPLAIALAAAGAIAAIDRKADRWSLVLVATLVIAGLPLTAPIAPGIVIAIAIGAGLAVAELAARAPRRSHQILAAASVGAMMIVSVAALP